MSWLVDQGPPEQALHLFSATWRFWWLRGHAAEFAPLGEQIAASSERLPPQQRAIALSAAGFILISNGDQAKAETLFEQNLELYRQLSDGLGEVLTATVLGVLGYLAALRRDYPRATDLLGQSQARLREVRDDDLSGYDRLQHLLTVALVDNFLGQIRLSQADNDGAARLFTGGLTVARRAQDPISLLISLYDLALTSQAQGDLAGAAGHLKEGLALAAEAGDETTAAYYLEGLAAVAGQQDDPSAPSGCSPPHAALGSQRQRLAARSRATCPARRCCPRRAALTHGRGGIRGGPGLGRIHRKQTRQRIRAGMRTTQPAQSQGQPPQAP